MLHRIAFDPIYDEIVKTYTLKNSDSFDTCLLQSEFQKSFLGCDDNAVGSFSENGFEFKLNLPNFYFLLPHVDVRYDAEDRTVVMNQSFDKLALAVQLCGFSVIFLVVIMFVVLAVLGVVLQVTLDKQLPIRNWEDVGGVAIVIFFIVTAHWSIKYFVRHRKSYWLKSEQKTLALLQSIGVSAETLHNYLHSR